MTEGEAQAWLERRGWWHGAVGDRLRLLAQMVIAGTQQQNLISAATIDQIWARHIVDSAQLVPMAGGRLAVCQSPHWVDLGTGAGFPGLVVAAILDISVTLVEMRRLRIEFLTACCDTLTLPHVTIAPCKAQALRLNRPADIISARAFAPLARLLADSAHRADRNSVWLLPKGRNAPLELASARKEWQAAFHVEQSVTDPDSVIIMAQGLVAAPRTVG